ncbi:MAG: glycogen debranching N-terminal domain-containing protein [Variibacter sp.]
MSTEGVSRSDHLVEETPFYIPATTDSATRARRTLKHGDCFAILDSHGDIGASPGAPDGVYFHDTRFLSRLELLINGFQPLLLGSNLRDDNSVLTVDLTNPDMYFEKRLVLPKDTVHIVRTIFLWRGTAHQRLSLRNHGERAVGLNLSFTFGSDFADLFEVRGMRRERRGRLADPTVNGADVLLAYEGLDKVQRQTRLFFDPAPDRLGASAASFRIQLAPDESRTLFLTATCDAPEFEPMSFNRSLLGFNRERREATRGNATVTASNTLFNEVLCRSMSDLYMLMTQTPDGPYPYAGTPYYSTTFGRDGLITAMQMLWFDPKVAAGVLRRLARLQATKDDAASDAQPGKILHEMRGGEMAALGEVPFALYYGSVDSTPLFVMLAGLYAQRTGDWELIETLWPNIEAALGWIEGPADPDGDGFVEYARATEQGLANQGWKDSFDAVFHADGSLAEGPVALAEVQGYVFAAKRLAAMCARRLGREVRAAELEASAARLAQKFEEAFWCPEIETYAVALDGKKGACKVRTSNAGQVLFSGIADAERARKVGRGLLGSDFFSGWGIRTVAREAARYNPMSYHNGSIWPHDNALIATGLARYGMKTEVNQVFGGLFDAATYMDLRRLPELFCGFKRRAGEGPTLYPVACAPQAWASGAPFMLLQAALGLEFDPEAREIRLRNPRLPAFLPEITLHNLRLGEAKITLSLHRQGEGVGIQTLNAEGAVRVSTILD